MEAESISSEAAVSREVGESLDDFLAAVQARALAMARFATGSTDDALDLVQDAMTSFVRRYRNKPAVERRPLFFRCLNNRILDWHRQRKRRGRWLIFGSHPVDGLADGPDTAMPAASSQQPERLLDDDRFGCCLESALLALPLRQRQVFLLRAWEGLDVGQSATALSISRGSVKTHYFRALAALRKALEEFND